MAILEACLPPRCTLRCHVPLHCMLPCHFSTRCVSLCSGFPLRHCTLLPRVPTQLPPASLPVPQLIDGLMEDPDLGKHLRWVGRMPLIKFWTTQCSLIMAGAHGGPRPTAAPTPYMPCLTTNMLCYHSVAARPRCPTAAPTCMLHTCFSASLPTVPCTCLLVTVCSAPSVSYGSTNLYMRGALEAQTRGNLDKARTSSAAIVFCLRSLRSLGSCARRAKRASGGACRHRRAAACARQEGLPCGRWCVDHGQAVGQLLCWRRRRAAAWTRQAGAMLRLVSV